MRLFFKTASSYLMFNRTKNVFQVIYRKNVGSVPVLQTSDLPKATVPMSQKEEVATKVCNVSGVVNKALRYVTFLYLWLLNSALTNNELYVENTKL